MSAKYKSPAILSQLTPTGTSEVTYHHVVLFSWDLNEEKPFEVYPRNAFSSNEIPEDWYLKELSPTCRQQKLKLSGLRGDFYSVFCKIEESK